MKKKKNIKIFQNIIKKIKILFYNILHPIALKNLDFFYFLTKLSNIELISKIFAEIKVSSLDLFISKPL